MLSKKQKSEKDAVIKAIIGYIKYSKGKELSYIEAERIAKYIHHNEATLRRLALSETGCNDEAKQNRYEIRIKKYIRETIGCEVYTQRIPRECCIRLHLRCDENENFYNMPDKTTAMAW